MSLPGRLVDLPFGRLFMHRSGDGPPLVLLHGYLMSHYYYRAVVEELRRSFDVIAFDLPGLGESDRPAPSAFRYDLPALADAVVAAIDTLGVSKAHWVGHSMGGGTALSIAARHAERIDRLVLEAPTVYPVPMPLEGRLALVPGIGPLLFKKAYRRADLARHFRNAYRDPAIATDELIDYYWERFNRPGGRDAGHALLQTLGSLNDNTADPERVKAPTLIVWGEEDRLVPLAHGRRLQRQIAGAALEIIPACCHSPHEERPEEFLRAIVPFLTGQRSAAKA